MINALYCAQLILNMTQCLTVKDHTFISLLRVFGSLVANFLEKCNETFKLVLSLLCFIDDDKMDKIKIFIVE